MTGKPLFDAYRGFIGYRGVGSDITEVRRTDARLAYMANFDALTGLANRSQFMARAEEECRKAESSQVLRALLYLDLDGFKGVNDTLGHASGDLLLRQVASRLRSLAPDNVILSRLGGDEFGILYSPKARSDAEVFAKTLIDGLSAPYLVEGSRTDVGASIGLAYAPEDGASIDTLLAMADLALYRAKAAGKGRYVSFRREFELQLSERRLLENDLRLAVARREFQLVYQPIVSAASGRIVCFEALIRWNSPERGLVMPVDFIPVIENIGLVIDVGRWALQQACQEARDWGDGVKVAVNISSIHFRSTDFVTDVTLALARSGLDAHRLEIEITESVFLDSSLLAFENLHALRDCGVRIALDDFGTGYSSPNYLVRFPVDKIKIDKSFVRELGRRENTAIIETICAMAQKLSIETTAEGVETIQQYAALRAKGCDTLQGFLLSHPVRSPNPLILSTAIAERLASLDTGLSNSISSYQNAPRSPSRRCISSAS